MRKFIKWIFLIVTIGSLVPFLLDKLIFGNSFYSAVTNDGWASFFGSYMGAIIGGLVTLGGVFLTIRHNEQMEKERKILEHRPYMVLIKDSSPAERRDTINFEEDNATDKLRAYTNQHFSYVLVNKGNGTAVDVCLKRKSLFDDNNKVHKMRESVIAPGERIFINICEYQHKEDGNVDSSTIVIEFEDIFKNKYTQDIKVDYCRNGTRFETEVKCAGPKLTEDNKIF